MSHLIKKWLFLILVSFPLAGFTQMDTLIISPDSLSMQQDSFKEINIIHLKDTNQAIQLDFNSYFILLGRNLKEGFTRPFHMTDKDWGNFGKFAVITFALSFTDEPIQKSVLKLRNRNTPINNISKYVTKFGGVYEVVTLAGLGTYGLVFKNEKLQTTTILATQAYITATALESVLKYISGRTRPSYYRADQEAEPRFLGPFTKALRDPNGKREYSSFPSGHTTVAFAAATVYASEYRDKPLVPIIAYSAASLIGVSRVTENKHWVTDVFVGATVGYLAGKQIVNSYHQHAKTKNAKKNNTTYSFNLNYYYGHWEPGLLVHFK